MMKKIVLLVAACIALLPSLPAQEIRKYEAGAQVSYGLGLGKTKDNHYGFDVHGGYKANDHWAVGAGLDFVNTLGRMDLPSGVENVYIVTDSYRAFRPYVYARYDVLPDRKWTPFAHARLGYAFFRNSTLQYGVFPSWSYGDYGTVDLSGYAYLKDLDHTLGVRGGVFGAIDLGVSLHVGSKGSKVNFGICLDCQPVRFEYNQSAQRRTNLTAGPKIGFTY